MTKILEKYPVVGVGIMTGTSQDAVDVAFVRFDDSTVDSFTVLYSAIYPFSDEIREKLQSQNDWKISDVSALNYMLGRHYANVVKVAMRDSNIQAIDFIGSHGQTVFHKSGIHTLQIGSPAFLAERFDVPVVHDFRSKDIAAGGCGAPLVPKFDELIFRSSLENRVCLNVGGIANIAILPQKMDDPVIALDTGPGMTLVDRFAKIFYPRDIEYHWIHEVAHEVEIHDGVWNFLIKHPFIHKQPPKSTGVEEFGDKIVQKLQDKFPDFYERSTSWMRTLLSFTAWAIVENVRNFSGFGKIPFRVIASGGGVLNSILFAELRTQFSPNIVVKSDKFGIAADSKEAIAFAFLAHETLRKKPGNIPMATGATKETILGSITF